MRISCALPAVILTCAVNGSEVMIMYSPKISDDLVMTIYKIGKYEGVPMTKVVDRFLRDSVRSYVDSLDDDHIAENLFYRKNDSERKVHYHSGIGEDESREDLR